MTEALIGGRAVQRLAPAGLEPMLDALFQNERVDGALFEGLKYSHCTFANVSFLKAQLISCTFENCAFIDCYFRESAIDSSKFLGCKFITCEFRKPRLRQVTFVYPRFRACWIAYDDVVGSLPPEANLRRDMADGLAREAETSGATRDARLFRLAADAAYERYLWNGVTGSDKWSRDHFPSLPDRSFAAARFVGRRINRLVWGYGERGLILVRNAAVIGIVIYPLIYGATDPSVGGVRARLAR